jgi:hypothetical protein
MPPSEASDVPETEGFSAPPTGMSRFKYEIYKRSLAAAAGGELFNNKINQKDLYILLINDVV